MHTCVHTHTYVHSENCSSIGSFLIRCKHELRGSQIELSQEVVVWLDSRAYFFPFHTLAGLEAKL